MRLSLAVVLAVLLALCLLATAGPALAVDPAGPPSFTWGGGFAGELDPGLYYPDTPELGNTTVLHWRIYAWMHVVFRESAGSQLWFELWDWNMVLLDEPGPTYPEDPNDLIQGWHYHWGTGIISSVDPSLYWPKLPPKSTWLWTTVVNGTTTPAGVHNITEQWTGCNAYRGTTALCTWTMASPNYTHTSGKVWIEP